MFPILNLPPASIPIPSLWVISVHQPQASSIVHRTWTGDSFHIRYYICFSAILPNHPNLSLSHRVEKTVLYICVSFAVLHTGLLLPSLFHIYVLGTLHSNEYIFLFLLCFSLLFFSQLFCKASSDSHFAS